MPDLFEMALRRETQERESNIEQKEAPFVKEEVLRRVEEAIQRLNSLKLPVTQISVLKIVGRASVEKFKEQVAALIRDEHIKQAQARADKLFSEVQSAVKRLEDLRKPITKRAIADIVGVSRSKLQNYPQISDLIDKRKNYPEYLHSEYQLHSDKLLGEVEVAIKKLEDEDRAITYRAVGEMVGMNPGNFKYYPCIRTLLEQKNNYSQYRRGNTRLRENELLTKVEAAMLQIESSGQAPTYLAISEIVGMHPSSLNRYPRIRTFLVQKINIHHSRQDVRENGLHEENLLAKVKIVICQLEKLGTPVTRRAISEAIGMRPNTLDHYPQIKTLLEQQYTNDYYTHLSVQSRAREDDLLVKIGDAVQLLKNLGRPVTQKAIDEILGIPSNTLWRYPRFREQLKQEVILYSLDDAAQIQIGEAELMEKLLEAKSALDSSGEPATPGTIRKLLGIRSSFLKHYPKVTTFLHSLEKQDVERRRQLREDELLVRAKAVVQELNNEQQPITQMHIARRIGCDTATLRSCPKVFAFVMKSVGQERQQAMVIYHQEKEEEIKKDVLNAIQQLQVLNLRVTILTIRQIVQVSRETLTRYPQVNEILDAVIKGRHKALLPKKP